MGKHVQLVENILQTANNKINSRLICENSSDMTMILPFYTKSKITNTITSFHSDGSG